MSTNSNRPSGRYPSNGRRPDPRASVKPASILKNRRLLALIAACVVLLAVIIGLAIHKKNSKKNADPANVNYVAEITVKDYGSITVALDSSAAPETVANFVELAKSGFYDGLTFHRIMDGFMIQGGDPDGNGTGGSGKNITGEFKLNGFDNPISHTRGTISMARANDPNSASSQFFIVQADSTFLDGSYAAFGRVTSGMEVVDRICADAEPTDNNGTIPAAQQPVITSLTISEAEAGK